MKDVLEELKDFAMEYGRDDDPEPTNLQRVLWGSVTEIKRLRAQVTDLTRLAGCAAIGKEFSEIKKELKHD